MYAEIEIIFEVNYGFCVFWVMEVFWMCSAEGLYFLSSAELGGDQLWWWPACASLHLESVLPSQETITSLWSCGLFWLWWESRFFSVHPEFTRNVKRNKKTTTKNNLRKQCRDAFKMAACYFLEVKWKVYFNPDEPYKVNIIILT